jgi:glutamine synthetase
MGTTDTTAGPKTSAQDVPSLVSEHDIQFVRLWFTDILGQLKSFAIGVEELEGALSEGMGFDGSSITGFNRIEESDMIAMPDPDTFAVLPWRPREKAVARMFCDVLVPGGAPYEGDPRFVMRRALERASAMGFDDYFIGPELEFFYFRQAELNGGPPAVLDKGGYFDLTTLDAASDLRRETVLALGELGIDVEYSHHEVGPSQHEIDMRFAGGLRTADNAMTYRITVKEIAMKYGLYATFMPKPLFGENGSGMHTHMLHAGLDGIEQGYELPPPPMETNLYDLSPDERKRLGIEQLPETLGEAIEEMASSELVLKALGEHVFTRYLDLKRAEWEDYRVQVTPWELERYLSIL